MPSTMSTPLITLSTSNALLRDLRSAYNKNDDSEITFVPFPTTAILPPPPVATETHHRPRPRRASKTMQRILSSKKKDTKPKTKKNKEWDRDLWDDDDDDTRDDAAYTLTATVFRHTDDDTPASRCRILSSKKRDTKKPTKKTNERKDETRFFDDDHRDDEFRDTTGDDEDWTTSRITIIKATESTPWDTMITNDHDTNISLEDTTNNSTINTTTADNASNHPRIRTPATAPPVGTKRYSKTDDDRASLYSNIIPSLLQSWNNFETGIINEINTTTTTKSNSNSNTMIRTILGGGSCYTDTTATAIATVSRPHDSLPVGGRVADGTLVTNDDVTTSLWSTTNFADIDAFSCGREGGDNTTNVQATRGIRKNMTMVGHWMATKTGDTNTSKMKPSGTKQCTAFPPPDGTAISDLYTTLRRDSRNNDDDGDDDIRDQPGGHTTLSSSAPVATITSAKAMEQRWRHYQQQLRQQQQQNQQQQNPHRGFTDNNKKERDERKESKSKSTTGLLKQRLERKNLQEERKGFDQQKERARRQSKESQIIYLQSKYEAEEPRKKNVLKKKKYKNNPSIINRLRCRDASIATPGQADEDGTYNWTGQAVKAGVTR